jgi:hypothetical protein
MTEWCNICGRYHSQSTAVCQGSKVSDQYKQALAAFYDPANDNMTCEEFRKKYLRQDSDVEKQSTAQAIMGGLRGE